MKHDELRKEEQFVENSNIQPGFTQGCVNVNLSERKKKVEGKAGELRFCCNCYSRIENLVVQGCITLIQGWMS